jgi:hypothetical protein
MRGLKKGVSDRMPTSARCLPTPTGHEGPESTGTPAPVATKQVPTSIGRSASSPRHLSDNRGWRGAGGSIAAAGTLGTAGHV